jgi:hypothetical protein
MIPFARRKRGAIVTKLSNPSISLSQEELFPKRMEFSPVWNRWRKIALSLAVFGLQY